MPAEILRLLESYNFLEAALIEYRAELAPNIVDQFKRERDNIFLKVLAHESIDPNVTLAQARFLINQLAELNQGSDMASLLRELADRHLTSLAEALLTKPRTERSVDHKEYGYLDSLSDRIAILDRDYRYFYTNSSNAKFHGEDARDFVGRPSWHITGDIFFERVNKRRFDQCFAGHPVSYVSAHPGHDPTKLYLVNIDPVQPHNDQTPTIMISCREVSHLSIPEELIVPADPTPLR